MSSRWYSVLVLGIWISSSWSFNGAQTTVRTYQNKTVVLPCHVDSLGVPTIVRWWKDDRQLADSGDPNFVVPNRMKMWDNMSLEISQVQPEDSGEYVCQATRPSSWGHVTQVHAIEVMYPPSVHSVPEAGELEVNLGEEVEIACIAKGVPYPSISWRMKDEEMKLLDERSKLRFQADNRSLSGRYTCVADNGVGDPATAAIELRICYKPEIEPKKSWIHASPGIRVQLDCRVSAWPEALVDWYFEGEKILFSSRIVKHTADQVHSLIIRNVRSTDYGYYQCKASNNLGVSEVAIEVSGIANAAVFKESNIISRNAYNFIWEVDSYSPIIEYQFWFRKYWPSERRDWHKLFIPSGSEAIGPLHSKSFNLTGLAPATYYEALVLARNRYGWSKPSKVLRFATEGAPPHKEHYKVEEVYEESAPAVVLGSPALQQSSSETSGADIATTTFIPSLIILIYFLSNLNLT
ncbi:neurotrimin [Diachasma alloeum]|uniref:neurotrimin n=1 Tax=Diachasma alloeum TaxID=454923 RepID=UPI0007381027|nr:neurotrimin [Diachasma alloeum]